MARALIFLGSIRDHRQGIDFLFWNFFILTSSMTPDSYSSGARQSKKTLPTIFLKRQP
jgi:hypothetical protein